jgi:hypothetical protein
VIHYLDATSKAFEKLDHVRHRHLVPSSEGKQPFNTSVLDTSLPGYDVAVRRLKSLLATDIQYQLSHTDLARLEGLSKSSLVLSSTIFAEIGQANRKGTLNLASLLEAMEFLNELTAHVQIECARLEK